MLSLCQLEERLEEGEVLEAEEVNTVIRENALDGELLREAAAKGYANMVRFFIGAENRFDLTPEEKRKCSNGGASDYDGTTPLHFAAANGHMDIVLFMISSEDSVNTTNRFSETPLYLASREGHVDIVRALIQSGAVLNRYSFKDRKTPIDVAAFNGHASVVECLLDAGAERGGALYFAVEAGREDITALLLRRFEGAKLVNMDRLALHQAAQKGHFRICEMLLNVPVEVSPADRFRWTPLEIAARHGHFDIVQLLLSRDLNSKASIQGVDPFSLRKENRVFQSTVLDVAIENGRIPIARLLNAHGFALNKRFLLKSMIEKGRLLGVWALLAMGETLDPFETMTPLHIACAGNQLTMVQFLLQRNSPVNARDVRHNTPLHFACRFNGSKSIVMLLINCGAEVNATNKDGSTPLILATNLCLQKILIESGADPHIPDRSGMTPLHKVDNVESAKLLLQCNVLVDSRTTRGVSPLMEACSNGHTAVVELLIEHGASVNSMGGKEFTPLALAMIRRDHDIMEILLNNGADVNVIGNGKNDTALHFASINNDAEGAQLLLKKTPNVNAKNEDGNTPLHLASSYQAVDIIPLLVECGAHINAVNNAGQTPLHLVRCDETMQLLLESGADATIQDSSGKTLLDYAERSNAFSVLSALQKHLAQNT